MKYPVSDFYFLSSAVDLKAETLEEVYENMCIFMGRSVSMPCLLRTVRNLVAGGYITVEPDGGVISAKTPISVSAAGKKAVAISPLQKLFGQDQAHRKNELRFCDLDSPDIPADGLTADGESFDGCIARLIRGGHIAHPMFEVQQMQEGYFKLTVHHPNDAWNGLEDDGEEIDPDAAALSYSASITCTTEQIKMGMGDLIETAYLFTAQPPRARKIALHGVDSSLLISLANAANEQGLVSLRITVAKIRFNRQRFVGKRDSDLDYAQCGEPIFITEMRDGVSFAFWEVLHSALAQQLPLDEADLAKLTDIHRTARSRLI